MHTKLSTLSAIGILLVAGLPAHAQSVQTGSITGTVRDKFGKPIDGARLRVKSGQTERYAVSNSKGEYRLPLLNVGEWTLTVIKDGFQTGTVKTRVEIHDTRVANFSMLPVEQVVLEVVGEAGNMDTTTTQVATNLSAERLAQIPMDMTSLNALDGLMASVPGVQTAYTGAFNIMGGTDDQNLFTVDGTVTNKTSTNGSSAGSELASTQPAREFIESVEVVTNAFGAEYGVFGGVVNALTKSGTNKYEGSLFYGTNFPHSQAMAFYNPNTTPPQKKPVDGNQYHRYGASASGPILKDKLFFFLGYQGFKNVTPPTTLLNGGLNWNGLKSDSEHATGPNQWTAKLNWFINSTNQLILSGTRSDFKINTGNQYSDYGTLNQGLSRESASQSVNLTWNWMPTSNLFVVASLGNFKTPSTSTPFDGATRSISVYDSRYFMDGPGSAVSNKPSNPAYVSYQTGNGTALYAHRDNPNTQYRMDLTWCLGNHQIKFGYLRQDTKWEQTEGSNEIYSINNSVLDPSGILRRLNWSANYSKYTGVLESHYLKDVVELLPGLRMDVGLRYDPFCYKGAFGPYDGMKLAEYDSLRKQLQPRIGLVWDVDQDGRKKVFAHFGRFFMAMPMAGITWAKTSGLYYDMWFPGSWTYNSTYAGGKAFTLLKNTPDVSMMLTGGEGKPQPHATDLRLPRKNTWTLGTDWTLRNNWTIGGLWTFWELKDVMEDSYFLNGDGSAAFSGLKGTKVIWNPGPGPVTFVDSNGVQHTWNSNFPTPKDRYIGLNLHATNHGERHYLSLDYTWTHHYGNYLGESQNYLVYAQSGQQQGFGAGGRTADYDYAQGISGGNYEGNPVHEFKARGGYRFGILSQDFNLGLTANWQSGIGLTKVMTAGAKWQANAASTAFGGLATDMVTTDNQRCNMGYTPSLLQVNLDLSATLKYKACSIKPNISINNVFNQRTVLGYYLNQYTGNYQSDIKADPNFGLVYTKQSGRSVTAGFSVQF